MEKVKETILLIENSADFVAALKRLMTREKLTDNFVLKEILTSGENLIEDCIHQVEGIIDVSDEIAIALVDIALDETTTPRGLNKGIDKSGQIVAKKLRKIIPHVPIVAITAHEKRSNVITDVSFDPNFDGLIPKHAILDPGFGKIKFLEYVEKAKIKLRHCRGISNENEDFEESERMGNNNEKNRTLIISNDVFTKCQVEEIGSSFFDEILFKAFGNAEGNVKYFTPGFSGAMLFEVEARLNLLNMTSSLNLTNWILKLSKDKAKLKLELDNHKNLKTRGITSSAYPNLLKEELISIGKWYALVTRKEKNSKTLNEYLKGNPELSKIETALENGIESFVSELYGDSISRASLVWQEFYKLKEKDKARILASLEKNESAFKFHLIGSINKNLSSIKSFLITNGESIREINELRKDVDTRFIHGDFHSRNILVNPENLQITTIDFPNTKQEHCVRDFAKLETDIIFSVLDSQNSIDTLWSSVAEWNSLLETLEWNDDFFFSGMSITVCQRLNEFHIVEIIRAIRKSAKRLLPKITREEYLVSLLSYALKLIPYPDITLPKKGFAIIYSDKIISLLSSE